MRIYSLKVKSAELADGRSEEKKISSMISWSQMRRTGGGQVREGN